MNTAKIIAVDFDGTICENRYPNIGTANEDMIKYLRHEQANGSKIILWTCRVGDLLEEAIKWRYDWNLIFDAINENLPEVIETFGGDTRKIFANEYIDDRNKCIAACTPPLSMEDLTKAEGMLLKGACSMSEFSYRQAIHQEAIKNGVAK